VEERNAREAGIISFSRPSSLKQITRRTGAEAVAINFQVREPETLRSQARYSEHDPAAQPVSVWQKQGTLVSQSDKRSGGEIDIGISKEDTSIGWISRSARKKKRTASTSDHLVLLFFCFLFPAPPHLWADRRYAIIETLSVTWRRGLVGLGLPALCKQVHSHDHRSANHAISPPKTATQIPDPNSS
jgi:hypothetical protein